MIQFRIPTVFSEKPNRRVRNLIDIAYLQLSLLNDTHYFLNDSARPESITGFKSLLIKN